MQEYNQMQIIKRRFFAMRNGIIADTLRKSGLDYRMIFGLNIPQICEIAEELPHTTELAEKLWADSRTRESMLLAPMLYPADEMRGETAARWLAEAPNTEVADILCHKLLRNVSGALDTALDAIKSESDTTRYTALRLLFNLLILSQAPSQRQEVLPSAESLAKMIRPYVEAELASGTTLTHRLCAQLLEEIDFILEDESITQI